MSNISVVVKNTISIATAVALITVCGEAQAQRAPVQIGGPNGVIMGGGMGFKVGGRNGIHFGGGQGAKFGPTEFGMHFGNGQGARFGGRNAGMQFGGGQGARFGTPEYGMQFGHGEGARFGAKGNPIVQFGGGQGTTIGRPNRTQQTGQPAQPGPNNAASVLEGPATDPLPPIVKPDPTPADPRDKGTISVLEKFPKP
jgi:hypothetical protein